MTCRKGWLVPLMLLLISACQAPPREPAPPAPGGPLAVPSATRYTVDPSRSEVRILAFREGPMARVGHNHVVQGPVSGTVQLAPDFHDSALALTLSLDTLRVDPADARRQEGDGFDSSPSEAAKEGTRENMLGPDGLNATRHPEVRLRSSGIVGPPWNPDVTLQITLRGVSREITVPVAVVVEERELTAIGTFAIRQSDFGISPFSVMGGALRVQDELRIRFRIVAESE